MVMSFALSLIPGFLSFLKLPIYNWAAKTCFRILSRSFSGVIQFHNKEYRPKSDGICVANHTTPIDVVVLSCDRSYALVNFCFEGSRRGTALYHAVQCHAVPRPITHQNKRLFNTIQYRDNNRLCSELCSSTNFVSVEMLLTFFFGI